MSGARVEAIQLRLRDVAAARRDLCQRLSELDDARELLIAELWRLDPKAAREESL